ncbi:hypothetical protein MBLNU230_g6820t1 [Neophaeotheca triangularis]
MDPLSYASARDAPVRKNQLTQAYNDVKHTAVNSVTVNSNVTCNFATLHRKFRIQKDRFVTWGLAWNDDEAGLQGSIDEAVVKAGLSETVGSVLNNIKEVFEQAESIARGSTAQAAVGEEKTIPTIAPFQYDESKFKDLLNDLTASVDTLYDLSRSRKALARGEHPRFKPTTPSIRSTKSEKKPSAVPKHLKKTPSFGSMNTTLVDPPSIKPQTFSRPALSPYVGLPPRIEMNALKIPLEGPPPYEAIGVPTYTRVMAKLIRRNVVAGVHDALGSDEAEVSVLIEYCDYDPTYRETGVAPPMQRLETVARVFRPMRPEAQTNLSIIGFFEDDSQPRIGLIYDLPYAVQQALRGDTRQSKHDENTLKAPLSLLKLVQKDKSSSGDGAAPALEDRFRLAVRLAEQLQPMHDIGIPHGNVNSSSVVFPVTASEPFASRQNQMRFPLWASFDIFSRDKFEGRNRTSNFNLYRHPTHDDQAADAGDIGDIKYDLYGLALLLLEIGLWHPLGDLYKPKYTLADFQTRLEKLWIPKLAAKCGSSYMRAVEACMQIANNSEADYSIVQEVYGQMLHRLRRCCLIDEEDIVSVDRLSHSSVIQEWQSRRQDAKIPDETATARQTLAPQRSFRAQTETPPETPATSFALPDTASTVFTADQSTTSPRDHEIGDVDIEDLHFNPPSVPQGTKQTIAEMKNKVKLTKQAWREHDRRGKAQRAVQTQASSTSTTSERGVHSLHSSSTDPQDVTAPTQTLSDLSIEQERVGTPTREHRPIRKEFALSMAPEVTDEWHATTMGQLSRLVERALKGSPESCSIAFTHYGETAETARPTYLVHCASTDKVKRVLRKHFKCVPCPFDVKVKKGKVTRSRGPARADGDVHVMRSMANDSDLVAVNPFYQERPLCGASIGAYKDDEHLPPVSLGGIVLVDGAPYGMSVHHMLEQDIDEGQNDVEDDDNSSETSSIGSASDDDDDATIPAPSEAESTVKQVSSTSDDTVDEPVNEDTPGLLPGEIFDIEITQPALDDAISCDLHADPDDDDQDGDSQSVIDEDHLLSFKLGAIHASSGLKRTNMHSTKEGYKGITASLPQEIDWALFELLPPRVHPFNVIKNGSQYCSTSPSPDCATDTVATTVLPSSALPGANVHCLGRTSGLAHGTISPTMDLVKIHGRSTFSASWTVKGDFGVGGDSGAWVISNETGGVCGHVLAERSGRTYICPMDLMVEDMRATLGAGRVALPGVNGVDKLEAMGEAFRALGPAYDCSEIQKLVVQPTRTNSELTSNERKVTAMELCDEGSGDGAQVEKTDTVVDAVEALSLEEVDTDGGVALIGSEKKKANRSMAPVSRRMIPA